MSIDRSIRTLIAATCLGLVATLGLGHGPAQAQARTAKPCAKGGPCAIGDRGPGGGIVFYDAGSKKPWGRYLEAARPRWAGSAKDPRVPWCTVVDAVIAGAAGIRIGAGAGNTTALVAACSSGAANTARAYKGGGKSNWYLPAKDELNALYKKRKVIGGLSADNYWSSTDVDAGGASTQYFPNGNQGNGNKASALYIRPIRAF